jgi:hypothetical protein
MTMCVCMAMCVCHIVCGGRGDCTDTSDAMLLVDRGGDVQQEVQQYSSTVISASPWVYQVMHHMPAETRHLSTTHRQRSSIGALHHAGVRHPLTNLANTGVQASPSATRQWSRHKACIAMCTPTLLHSDSAARAALMLMTAPHVNDSDSTVLQDKCCSQCRTHTCL